jgi:hypothetical protein
MRYLGLLFISLFLLNSCADRPGNSHNTDAKPVGVVHADGDPFGDYWDQGKAEITTYDLKQARYGEIHDGIANTIFVTEPFSKSKHVKLDNPSVSPADHVHSLKLNFTRKFYTGVYPYSTMLSVFKPIDQKQNPKALKAVFSAQEWCGQVFTQLDLASGGYDVESFSYFESEGDLRSKVKPAVLEDELWLALRINPESLPTGKFNAVPGLTFSRLSHQPVAAVPAIAELTKGEMTNTYRIQYPSLGRTLSIDYTVEFPYEIVSWQEKGMSGFGANRTELTTMATLKARKMLDYWNKHDVKDAGLREELGL